jgi:UPF0271 protein
MDIDLNCDLGEGCEHDAELIALVTTVNVSCGFHAGDPATALAALAEAKRRGVQAGAHPSFPDREHFGRQEMVRSEAQIFTDTIYQVSALAGLARLAGLQLSHIKPHGALYNMACRDEAYARPLVEAAVQLGLPLMALPGSRLETLCSGRCRFVAEGFADRRYQPNGSLVPRHQPDAFVADPSEAVRQVSWLLRERGVETICVHGDNAQALGFVRALRQALTAAGHSIRPFAKIPIAER